MHSPSKALKVFVCGIATLAIIAMVPDSWANDEGESNEEKEWPWNSERLVLKTGVIFLDFDSDVTLDGDTLIGDPLNLQSDLGFDDSETELFLELTLRLSKRQRLEFTYIKIDLSAIQRLSKTINFGDQTFTLGSDIRTSLDLAIFRVSYGYSFLSNERRELGFVVGTNIVDAEAGINDLGSAKNADGDYILPVPDLGLYFSYDFTPKVAFLARSNIFYIEFDNYEVLLFTGSAAIEVYPRKHLLFGVGYRLLDLDFDVDRRDFDGELDFRHFSPFVYTGLRF